MKMRRKTLDKPALVYWQDGGCVGPRSRTVVCRREDEKRMLKEYKAVMDDSWQRYESDCIEISINGLYVLNAGLPPSKSPRKPPRVRPTAWK